MLKEIDVVGAVIIKDDKVFAVRRSYGSQFVIHKMEFAGGKIQEGESGEEAVKRECKEELDLEVEVFSRFSSASFDYPDKRVNLTLYFCVMKSSFILKEHEEFKWIEVDLLDGNDWAPADKPFLEQLKRAQFIYNDNFVIGIK